MVKIASKTPDAGGLDFMFKVNPAIPHGKVAVKELGGKKWLVMASQELTDAQIIMAISRYIAALDEHAKGLGDEGQLV